MSDTKINWKAVAFYTVLLTVCVLSALYFLKDRTPVYAAINMAASGISGLFQGVQLPSVNGVFEWVQQNPVVSGVLATLGTTAVTYFIKNWQTNKLLDKTVNDFNEAKTELSLTQQEVGKVSTKLSSTEETLKMYTEDKTAEILQTRINEMKDGYERQLTDLNRKLAEKEQELKARPFVQVPVVK